MLPWVFLLRYIDITYYENVYYKILLQELVLEKESRMRETLKIMGMGNWVMWTTWFLKQLLFLLLSSLIFGVILCVGEIFPNSSIPAVLILMFVYLLTLLSFSFLVRLFTKIYITIKLNSRVSSCMYIVFIYYNYYYAFVLLYSVWFNSSRLGMIAGFVFWFLTYFPHLFLAQFYDTLPL